MASHPAGNYDLVLLRHGHALNAREAGVCCDSQRPLSGAGETEAQRSALRLKQAGFRPDLIAASPFLRARRTAEIAAGTLGPARALEIEALSSGDAAGVIDALAGAGLPPGSSLLVVGHQPLLGELAGFFLGLDPFPLSPAGFVRISAASLTPDGRKAGQLTEHYTPAGTTV